MRRPALALALAFFVLCAVLGASSAVRAAAVMGTSQALVAALSSTPSDTLVVVAPLRSDVPATKGDELALRVGRLVAGQLMPGATAHGQPLSLAVARSIGRKRAAMLYLEVAIARGELQLNADLYVVPVNSWDRLRSVDPPPRRHAYAAAPVDVEVRAFLPRIPLEKASLHRARHDEGDVFAVACGDADGDGGLELALLSRRRVALGRLRGGAFVTERTASWATLSPRAPVPLREPLAGLAFVVDRERSGGAVLLAGVTDREGVALGAALDVRGAIAGIPLAFSGACAVANPETSAFDAVVACSGGARLGEAPATRFDAFAKAGVGVGAEAVSLVREPGGKLHLRFGGRDAHLDGVGAQIAVADLDQDGVAEVVTSAESGDDQLSVVSWDGVSFKQRLRFPAPAGVRALATCPPEDGVPALVAVVGSEVWLVR